MTNTYPKPVDNHFDWIRFSHDIALAIPLMSVSFNGHYNVLNLYKELSNRSMKRFTKAVVASSTFSLLFYTLIGFVGYYCFRGDTMGNIVNNYAQNDLLAIIARVGVSITVTFSFPMAFFAFRKSMENNIFSKPSDSFKRQWFMSTVLVSALVSLAVLEDRIENVVRLSGSSGAMFVVFILPAVFYLKLSRVLEFTWKIRLMRFTAWTNIIAGFVFMIFGMRYALQAFC
ncbi:hypothetical protein GEMRC1_003567 [Eukaryota sp. GEM-RC1]